MKVTNEIKTLQKLIEILHILVEVVPVERELYFVKINYLNIDESLSKGIVIELRYFFVETEGKQRTPVIMIVGKQSLI